MPRNESSIEIAAPPSKVREVILNFPALSEWHKDHIRRIAVQDKSKNPESLVPGDKLDVDIEGTKFVAEVKENSENLFAWQGPPVFTVAGFRQFKMEPTKDGTATIFTQSEDLEGLLAWLMSPSLLGKKMKAHFDMFNNDLKTRAEST
ncbi:hypothetical protein N7532_005876 [Penicillium argentinense]|uniref:SRPBCC family protein n=1 Tax=Penicillium argentinense TaxID=1131581 RepID=A0A9W9FF06_9EURO|nr:uncharacterized protein N7532_005876 [Penicillium argentinense]KAJ5098875.1 hypothetical protein N7532_005876 [Penicillium argentinense]